MVEIAKCRLCGSEPKRIVHYWICSNTACCVCGPADDHVGTKWNALMSPAPEPAAGTVRVRLPVWVDENGTVDGSFRAKSDDFEDWNDRGLSKKCVRVFITADIPLLQPVEIPGAVENGE